MLVKAVAKSFVQDLEELDPTVEGFVASTDPILELGNLLAVQMVLGGNFRGLAFVATVANRSLSIRNLRHQPVRLPEDSDVVSGWQERPVDPNEPILADRDAQLVRETWPTKLVGVPLGSRILPAPPSAAVDAVHRQKKNTSSLSKSFKVICNKQS